MVTKAGPRCFRAVLSGGAASQRTRGLGWCAMHPKGCDDAFSRGGSRLEPPTPGAAPGGDSAPVPGSRFPGSKAGKEFLAPSLFARSYGRSPFSVLVFSLFVSGWPARRPALRNPAREGSRLQPRAAAGLAARDPPGLP